MVVDRHLRDRFLPGLVSHSDFGCDDSGAVRAKTPEDLGTRAIDRGPSSKRAESALSRFRGLMFRGRLEPGEALYIRPCGSIHMMFMFFAIDAVFVDEELRVTKVARGVKPWIGISFGGRGSKSVIELARGAADGIRAGDQLAIAD